MPQPFQLQRPKRVLQDFSRLPAQVLPSGIGRPLANFASSVADSLPEVTLPASLPIPQLPAGFAVPPTPKQIAMRLETVLPAGVPRLSSALPDITVPGVTASAGPASGEARARPFEKTGTRAAGASTGGYRRIS